MKQKDFVINLVLLIFLNLLIKPFWLLGIDLGVQNSVGASQYGLYFAIFNFTFLFNMLLDMGITNFNNRNIARHSHLLQKHVSGILSLKLLLGLFYLVVTFVVGIIIGYRDLQIKILFWTAINQFLNSFILYLRSNISGLLLFKTDSIFSILDRLLVIIICGILLWGGVTEKPFQIEWFVYCQTAGYLISAIVALIVVISKSKLQRLNWNFTFLKMILKKSAPFAILYLLMSFYNRIDSVMIERLLPSSFAATETGIYASAFRLLDALVQIAYLFSVILLPLFSRMLKEKNNITPIVKTSFSLLFYFSITATILLVIYRMPIMGLLYKDHAVESAAVFRFLIPCIIPISFTYIFGTLLTANGNMKILNITSIIGIIVNVAVNLILIPRMHATGAAIASLSTQATVCVIQIFIVSKALKFKLSELPYIRSLIYTALLLLTTIVLFRYINLNPLYLLLINSGLSVLYAFATGLISLKFVREFRVS